MRRRCDLQETVHNTFSNALNFRNKGRKHFFRSKNSTNIQLDVFYFVEGYFAVLLQMDALHYLHAILKRVDRLFKDWSIASVNFDKSF